MSSFHSEDFDNNWNDTSSSFQDLLLENVDQIESNAYITPKKVDTRVNKKQKRCFNDSGFQVYRDKPTLPPTYKNETINPVRTPLSDSTNLIRCSNEKHHIETKEIEKNLIIDECYQKIQSTQQGVAQYDDDIWLEFEDINIPEDLINADKSEPCTNAKESSIKEEVEVQLTTSLEWIDNTLQQFGGFKTAGSKKEIKPSDTALKLANENAYCLLSSQSSQPLSPFTAFTQNKYQQNTSFSSIKSASGFTTGRGTHLNEPSKEAKKRANNLFFSNLIESSQHRLGSEVKEYKPIISNQAKHKNIYTESTSPLSDLTLVEHDNLIEKYGGFFKANGRKEIPVSKTARTQALKFLHADTTEKNITSDNDGNNDIITADDSTHQAFYKKRVLDIPKNSSVPELNNQISPNIVTRNDNLHDCLLPPACSINSEQPHQQHKDNADKTIPPKGLNTYSELKSINYLQQRKNRTSIQQYKIKPFKSPATDLNLVKSGLEKFNRSNDNNKSANSKKNNYNQSKSLSVFNLNPVGCRRPLYTLGTLKKYTNTELVSMGIPREIVYSTPVTSRSLHIKTNWNVESAKEEIIENGVLSHLIPKGWIENHYGWIVWKLTRRICMFPQFMYDWWYPDYIINQLLYRYEREINLGHRPVLKKIMEQDDIPAKHMVLMIADIVPSINSNEALSTYKSKHRYQLLLTDGWYAILASMDLRMEEAIIKGNLRVGHKLSIIGAQLIGDRLPSQPLDSTFIDFEKMTIRTSVGLLISSNSCQKCPWYTKLGYQPNYRRNKPKRKLETIHEDGGLITMLDVIICKKYPMIYIETLDNGTIRARNTREEEAIRWKVQPSEQRQVSSYFRLRLCDVSSQNTITNSTVTATLLVSQATEIMYMDLMEGQCYRIYFLQPHKPKNNKHYGKIHLKTSFQTKWEPLPQHQSLNTFIYPFRTVTTCASILNNSTDSKRLMDMDIVVYVLYTQPLLSRKQDDSSVIWYQTMLVTDTSKQLCQITLQSFLKPIQNFQNQFIGLVNVWYDTYDAKFDVIHVKTSYETEVWTKPIGKTMTYMQTAMEELKQWAKNEPNELIELRQRVEKLIKQ